MWVICGSVSLLLCSLWFSAGTSARITGFIIHTLQYNTKNSNIISSWSIEVPASRDWSYERPLIRP